ncbi:thioredoxin domain-containing protein [Dinghuibacter silviterrae]|uniref:Thiol-disulfide isomerase/thioredoxin n=1 Tax=Dinghuibacter silviterrae TaxID=1539049 RepID=A0A4V3GLP3_9BACT|nr:redoxin domain-containing protein [Dinghuibacter silviterrae]TDX00313.1 thiol-disulfide isomerase/thioredoxin [Dinghuibacter silviterrae]
MKTLLVCLLMVGVARAQTPFAGAPQPALAPLPALAALPGAQFSWADVHTPYVVIVYLSPSCPLSQRYTVALNALAAQYAGSVSFVGVFAGKADPDADILAFRDKYRVAFSLQRDPNLALARRLHATVTPEVFLLDARHRQLYRGAIDDKAVSLGNSRPQALHSWLKMALDDVLAARPVGVPHTEPVGCLIDDR